MSDKYKRVIRAESIDVYDILKAYSVTCPAVAHAIKKLLQAGNRGYKSEEQDLVEARQIIDRAIELSKE